MEGITNMHEHTERLLASSERWLRNAAVETLSEDVRISAAFVAGYNILQAVQAPYQASWVTIR
jgi:hypothetical protein